jgi:hypothetical protein
MDAIETREVHGFSCEVVYDFDPMSPRDYGDMGTKFVLSHGRYDFPNEAGIDLDEYGSWEEVTEALSDHYGALVAFPVHAYEHGGIAMSVGDRTGLFSDPWDSGFLGVVYVDAHCWEVTQGSPWTGSEEDLMRAGNMAKAEVEEYAQYVNGEVFGFIVKSPTGEIVESCWGFYSIDDAMAEAVAEAEAQDYQLQLPIGGAA